VTERRPLLTAAQLADLLGVTRRWVYLQVEEHQMPAYRIGERALRFDPGAVQGWLETRKVGDWKSSKSCGAPISRVPL
jgi:excisionase family DNA binding protein